jgi:hypothetical protein
VSTLIGTERPWEDEALFLACWCGAAAGDAARRTDRAWVAEPREYEFLPRHLDTERAWPVIYAGSLRTEKQRAVVAAMRDLPSTATYGQIAQRARISWALARLVAGYWRQQEGIPLPRSGPRRTTIEPEPGEEVVA